MIDTITLVEEKPQPFCFEFHNNQGFVGRLTYTPEGVMTFEGDADASAMMFFNNVIRENIRLISEHEQRIRELEEKLKQIQNCRQVRPTIHYRSNEFTGMRDKLIAGHEWADDTYMLVNEVFKIIKE